MHHYNCSKINTNKMTLLDYTLFHFSSGVHFLYTVQAVSGIMYNPLLYSTRSPMCSVPDCLCVTGGWPLVTQNSAIFCLLPSISLSVLLSFLPSLSHSHTCRTAHTRPARGVLGDAGRAYSQECCAWSAHARTRGESIANVFVLLAA